MAAKNLRTADYSEQARIRLGDAVAKARRATGHRWRPSFVKATSVGKRSLEAIERAEPTVGISALEDVGRALGEFWVDWTADTPRSILEGGQIPPLHPRSADAIALAVDGPELRDEFERAIWGMDLSEDEKWIHIDLHRARLQRRSESGQTQTG